MKKGIVIIICVLAVGSICMSFSFSEKGLSVESESNLDSLQFVKMVNKSEIYDTFSYHEFDVVASYLAGVMPEDSDMQIRNEFSTQVWKNFSTHFSPRWESYDKNDLSVIKKWSKEHLTYTDSLIYPFSGPDFNYLNTMFPNTDYALLIALEGVGSAPNISKMSEDTSQKLLTEVEKSLYYNLKCSFFRTYSMEDELNTELLDGTMPLLLMFMKSHGYEILNVYPVWMNEQGRLSADTTGEMYAHSLEKSFDNAAAFIYRMPGEKTVKELVYMSLDLSNKGIEEDSLTNFLSMQIKDKTVFLKAASYLCDQSDFQVIRDLILNNANQVVTDPSGIKYDDFTDDWNLTVHGKYTGPISLFGSHVQNNLILRCRKQGNSNLPFRFGYHGTHWSMIDAHRITEKQAQ